MSKRTTKTETDIAANQGRESCIKDGSKTSKNYFILSVNIKI